MTSGYYVKDGKTYYVGAKGGVYVVTFDGHPKFTKASASLADAEPVAPVMFVDVKVPNNVK